MSPSFTAQTPPVAGGVAVPHQVPAERGCGTWGHLGHPPQEGDHRAALGVGQVSTDKFAPFLQDRSFGDQGLQKYSVYMTRGTSQTGREA